MEASEPLLLGEPEKIGDHESERIPEWKEQITMRGLVVSAVLGDALLYHHSQAESHRRHDRVPQRRRRIVRVLPRQVTCVVASYGIAFSGGFGSYLIAMDDMTYKVIGVDYPGNRAEDVKNPGLWWIIGFLFVVSFLGLFSVVPLRKIMIMDYKLTYPNGTATAMLINSFHMNTGAELAGVPSSSFHELHSGNDKTMDKEGGVAFVSAGIFPAEKRSVQGLIGGERIEVETGGKGLRKRKMGDCDVEVDGESCGENISYMKKALSVDCEIRTLVYRRCGRQRHGSIEEVSGGGVVDDEDTLCNLLNGPDSWFYFDFSPTYVGCGLICPYIVNCSLLLGAIISWGFLWPYISQRAGDWYPADLGSTDFKGLYGYKVFIAMSLILGDGLYNLMKIMAITVGEMCNNSTKQNNLPLFKETTDGESSELLILQRKQDGVFLKDRIPSWFTVSGYVGLAAISIATIPSIFPPLKWYLILFSYIIAPALAFGNSYATGLTNWTVAGTYGKISIFIVASFVGSDGGVIAGLASCGVIMSIVNTAADLMQDFKTGYLTLSSAKSMFVSQLIGTAMVMVVIAGLASCGVIMSIVNTAADLMQDFKTGYLTLSSAKSMFVSQLIGTAMGCIISPLTFWMFWTAFDVGSPDGQFKVPFGVIYREMAILGVEGFSKLPKHCLALCCGFFVAALVINLLRDLTPANFARFIPIPMAMGGTFYIGAYLAIDMFVGTVILFVWERINRKDAEDYAGAVASGLICGDGIWTVPSAILSIFRVDPPICMYFRPSLSR
ncbi:YELLOW STRIPE like 6 [Actinidia rufa]|uniref:YELLOW STRIPE like 6 n=1 Tax=Actinidia rufa TaxID=165716 RepID=A0A7J0EA51_9ERIC|nr:YELLOW STRIPE like 6 [Actinidia rufa]